MIAEMMADMRAEYERREEVLHREIVRLTQERDDALARAVPPAPARCAACGAAVALLALMVALMLPTKTTQMDDECAACRDELQAMRLVDTDGEDYVCELEGAGGHGGE